jgi:hypothetical protein
VKPRNWRRYYGSYRPPSYRIRVSNGNPAPKYMVWLCETRGWSEREAQRYCQALVGHRHGKRNRHRRFLMSKDGELASPAELDEERFLARAEKYIRAASTKAGEAIVKIGFELTLVKAKVGHGKYETFVRDRLGWSPDTALRFTRVFELAKSRNVRDFTGLTIDASSLYLIAAPGTPEAAREEVLERAATAKGITHTETKQVVADHKAASPKPAAPKPAPAAPPPTAPPPAAAPTPPRRPPLDSAYAKMVRDERPKTLTQLSALLRIDTKQTVEAVITALKDSQSDIAALPEAVRMSAARGCLRALGVNDNFRSVA